MPHPRGYALPFLDRTVRILLAGPERAELEKLSGVLCRQSAFDVSLSSTRAAAEKALGAGRVHVCLYDLRLGGDEPFTSVPLMLLQMLKWEAARATTGQLVLPQRSSEPLQTAQMLPEGACIFR